MLVVSQERYEEDLLLNILKEFIYCFSTLKKFIFEKLDCLKKNIASSHQIFQKCQNFLIFCVGIEKFDDNCNII
jgi:hypothetical protein